jgi:prepilin-type N-terminal cleavage/methylation domain-containing protein
MKTRRDRGFSLVELMLVLAIVAILIAIAIPSLLGFRTRANDVQVQSELAAVGRGQAGLQPLQNGFTDDLDLLRSTFPEIRFGDADDRHVHVTLGDVVAGDNGQVLMYARSDSGTWFGVRHVAGGADVGRHTCSGAESDMTLVACSGDDW